MDKSIIIFAHNIRSLWNVGSLFRSSDCFGVDKIYLSGYTGTPPRREISKTAIGAEEWIPWEKVEDFSALTKIKSEGYKIVSLELSDTAINVFDYEAPEKICLVLGNEVLGVPEEVLEISDDIIYIPMHGKNESLNVSVATGIALHHLCR